MPTKQCVVMHHTRSNIEDATFQEDFTDRGHPRNLVISSVDWLDMGSPEVVTVTIEPGDLLNDDPISR